MALNLNNGDSSGPGFGDLCQGKPRIEVRLGHAARQMFEPASDNVGRVTQKGQIIRNLLHAI
eukprot:471100-Pyramimonas_sp.AAC.1